MPFLNFLLTRKRILDDPGNLEAMRWSEDGRSMFLALENEFPAHLLERLATKSYQSLVRRLYYFGFHKTGGVYHHDLFLRGQPSLILPVRRMSGSPSRLSPRDSTPSGPRYKVIKRKRTRQTF